MTRVMSIGVLVLPLVFVVVTTTGGFAQVQNLDQDKSGVMLFAGTCKDCHRSARGLTKGRISWALSRFLQQHYASSSASAQAITVYLQSMDAPPAKPQPAVRKSQLSAPGIAEPVLRPPASVPAR